MRKLSTYLLIALIGASTLAACGGKSSSSTQTITSSTSGQGTSSIPGGAATVTSTTQTPPPAPAKVEIAACERTVLGLKTLAKSTRSTLLKHCVTAGASPKEQRKVLHELCQQLIKTLPPADRARAELVCHAP